MYFKNNQVKAYKGLRSFSKKKKKRVYIQEDIGLALKLLYIQKDRALLEGIQLFRKKKKIQKKKKQTKKKQ